MQQVPTDRTIEIILGFDARNKNDQRRCFFWNNGENS